MARKPTIRFYSDAKSVSSTKIDTTLNASVVVTGTVALQIDQEYEEVQGRPEVYPRQASVFKSSSMEIYDTHRYANIRQRRSLDSLWLSTGSESWTQRRIGLGSHAFVMQPISSSRHEVQVLGLFYSGTRAESTTVPYSSSMYYEKSRPLKTMTWKWVASASMGGFVADRGQLIANTASVGNPHIISVEAPAGADDGRLVDVKVWVEVLQMSGATHPPLGLLGISLRNPNVSWGGDAHPLRNDKITKTITPWESSGTFYRDTYLLWEGPSLFRYYARIPYPASPNTSNHTEMDSAVWCPVWDRDIGMRTIFTDSAGVRNPRDIYAAVNEGYPGIHYSPLASKSPNGAFLGYTGSMWGLGVPWYSDGDYSGSIVTAGSPPPGWLNGPGGTSAGDEWPTTGVNYGPEFIKPVYPLLDDVLAIKPNPMDSSWKLLGSRPGLRGKQIGNRWEFLFALGISASLPNTPTYVRQLRLEFTYETTPGTSRPAVVPSKRKRSIQQYRHGRNLVGIVSGSMDSISGGSQDYLPNWIYINIPDHGQCVGIVHDTASLAAGNFAVYTASVPMTIDTASYDRSLVLDVLDPSKETSKFFTLGTLVSQENLLVSREQQARTVLSGTV